jgi:hypothetical protein
MKSQPHLLLALAKTYNVSGRRLDPGGCTYDKRVGAWITREGTLFVDVDGASRPRTKKEDVETGEDQKGE